MVNAGGVSYRSRFHYTFVLKRKKQKGAVAIGNAKQKINQSPVSNDQTEVNEITAITSMRFRSLRGSRSLIERYKDKVLLLLIYKQHCLSVLGRALPTPPTNSNRTTSSYSSSCHSCRIPTREGQKNNIQKVFLLVWSSFLSIYDQESYKFNDSSMPKGTPTLVVISSMPLYRS